MVKGIRTFVFVAAAVMVWTGLVYGRERTPAKLLVDSVLLGEAGLTMQWQASVPVKPRESIDRINIYGKYLFVMTDTNYMVCINRENGAMRFGVQLADPGLPICPPVWYEDKLWYMIGTTLKVLDPFSGVLKNEYTFESIGRSSVCNMARNESYLYVAGSERRLNALYLNGYWVAFQVTADDDSLITSLVGDNRRVIYATDTGRVVSISADGPRRNWQFNIIGQILAPVVMDDEGVYVSSTNTKLYKLGLDSGKMMWEYPFQAGAVLTDSVALGKQTIYQYAGVNGLYAVDKTTGREVWQLESGLGFITEAENRAYVMARNGVLAVMDNAAGAPLRMVNFAAVTDYAYNPYDSVIYVSDEKGRVAAIAEKKQ